jgi:transposase-like protein/IS1 family transposase
MVEAICPLIIVLVFCALGGLVLRYHQHHRQLDGLPAAATLQRLLKPRTPDDCPVCRRERPVHPIVPPVPPPPGPWRERKSRRGAPKRIATQGFACPNATCAYCHITDADVHALVGDGSHGKRARIQPFRCQACGTTFTSRRDTPLYRLKTPSSRVAEVLTAVAEGLSISAAVRVFGHSEGTITTWLARAGEHSASLHERWFRHLQLPHLQLDELRTRLHNRASVLWLWVAMDPRTKLIPVLHLGARTQQVAHTLVHELRHRLAPNCIPVFTSDGLNHYFYALTAHFGQWVTTPGRRARQWHVAAGLIYGQVKKRYCRRRLVGVTSVMHCGTRAALREALMGLGLSGRLNTAFVERLNLAVRQSVAALGRRSWATAQAVPELLAHLEWWRGYYHFVRPHGALRVALTQPIPRGGRHQPRRYSQQTPAMAAGLTNRRWTVRELLALPLPLEPLTDEHAEAGVRSSQASR